MSSGVHSINLRCPRYLEGDQEKESWFMRHFPFTLCSFLFAIECSVASPPYKPAPASKGFLLQQYSSPFIASHVRDCRFIFLCIMLKFTLLNLEKNYSQCFFKNTVSWDSWLFFLLWIGKNFLPSDPFILLKPCCLLCSSILGVFILFRFFSWNSFYPLVLLCKLPF